MPRSTVVSTRDVLLHLWRAYWKYPWLMMGVMGSVVLAVGADTIAPWFIKNLIDGLSSLPQDPSSVDSLQPILLSIFFFWVLSQIGWRLNGLWNLQFQPRVMKDLEVEAARYVFGHSHQFFGDSFTGSLVRRIRRISRAAEGLADEVMFTLLPAALVLVGSLIGLGLRSPNLAFIFAAWCALFITVSIRASRWQMELNNKSVEQDSIVTGVLSDGITNAITIKAFGTEKQEVKQFETVSNALRVLLSRSWGRGEVVTGTQGALTTGISIAFFVLGVHGWSRGDLTAGDFVFMHIYLMLVFHQLWNVGRGFRKITESISDASELVEILQQPHQIRDRRGAKSLKISHGAIEFRNVGFAFHKTRSVFTKFSLKITPGEKVALVGPSGAGKSTVTKLLFRFYDVDGGKVLIDGQDISGVTQESLRRQIALVPQEPILFHRTLRENILYGRPDASEQELLAASKKAHAHEFISQLPEGYEAFVGERGVKLSGGERQRIAIARAILKNAPILVLDEATSSLDSENEHYIQEALHELMKGKTVIVIAHRLSTIMEMDRIVVIEGGEVTATGTHQELLHQGGTYQRLWNIQAGGFIKDEDEETV